MRGHTFALGIVVIAVAFGGTACGKKKSLPANGTAGGSASATGSQGAGSGDGTTGATIDTPLSRAAAGVIAARAGSTGLVKPADADGAATLIGAVIDQLTKTLPAAAREGFDPDAITAKVGGDRVKLFKWVRDKTALVPYRGSLRGPVGVLMDRHGNSLDRALLLAKLVATTGSNVRLAHATLPPDQVAIITKRWATRKPPPLPAWDAAGDPLQPFARLLKIDRATLEAQNAKVRTAWNALAEQAKTRIVEQTRMLSASAPAAGAGAASDTSAFADHWWVQVELDGNWSDLDPTLPDAEPGVTLAAADETLSVDDATDEAHSHTLTIRLVGELWTGTERREEALVEHTFAPRDFYGQQIEIKNVPIDMPTEAQLAATPDRAAAIRAAVSAQTEWMTMIVIGGVPIAGENVTDSGEVWKMTGPDANTMRLGRLVSGATKRGVGGATGMLDTLPGTADDPNAGAVKQPPIADQTGFTAEWIELELRSPGAAPKVIRRPVFDLFGDRSAAKRIALSNAARLDRGLALASDIDVLPMFARLPPGFVADRVVKALVNDRAFLVEAVRAKGGKDPGGLRDRVASLTPLPGALYALASTRFAWSGNNTNVYLDRLDVLVHRRTYRASPNGRIGLTETLDFAANGVGVWPSAGDPRAIRIQQGVADTVAEAVIQVGCLAPACRRDNTSDHFAAAGGKGWTRVEAGAAIDAPRVAPRVRDALRADLAGGYAVVLPATPGGASTWWRIDPTTGETLGMGELGGTAMAEYIEVAANVVAGVCACIAVVFKPHPTAMDYFLCAVGLGLGIAGGGAAIGAEAAETTAWAIANASAENGMIAVDMINMARNAGGVLETVSAAAAILDSVLDIYQAYNSATDPP